MPRRFAPRQTFTISQKAQFGGGDRIRTCVDRKAQRFSRPPRLATLAPLHQLNCKMQNYPQNAAVFVAVLPEGVEPPTSGSEDQRSIQLSYGS